MKEILERMFRTIREKREVYCLRENVREFVRYCRSNDYPINGGCSDETGMWFYV